MEYGLLNDEIKERDDYVLEDEPMVKEYREKRKCLEEAVEKFNRYLRKATYELALNDGPKEVIKALQVELKLTDTDEMQIYFDFSEQPEQGFSYEFMTWSERLQQKLECSNVPNEMEKELNEQILNIAKVFLCFYEF